MSRRDISIRPGVKVEVDIDDETGAVQLIHTQDVEPLLQQAKQEREGRTDWRPWQGNKKMEGAIKVCSLGPVHQMILVQQGIATFDNGFQILDEKRFQRWLDTYQDGALKSTKGRAFNV
jgi:hypothetical protein